MKNLRYIGGALLLCAAQTSQATEPEWGLKFSALGASPLTAGGSGSARLALEPSVKWLSPSIEWRARVRARWVRQQGEHRTNIDVRELTATWRGQETTVTLGSQQLNWGRMDILRLSDVINPVDQHDLFFEELPEAKLALWMLNAEWYHGSDTWQLVVAPDVSVDRLSAVWNGLPVDVRRPEPSVSNTTVALRYVFEASGWNADLMAVRGWRTTPVLHLMESAAPPNLVAEPVRQDSVGFSADRPLGSTVLRLEGLYARLGDSKLQSLGTNGNNGTHAGLGAGLDLQLRDWFLAGQVVAEKDDRFAGSLRLYLSAIVQKKWLQDRLAMRALYIQETRSDESWISLRLSYEVSKSQSIQLQADKFYGRTQTTFGAFRAGSRASAMVRLDF